MKSIQTARCMLRYLWLIPQSALCKRLELSAIKYIRQHGHRRGK